MDFNWNKDDSKTNSTAVSSNTDDLFIDGKKEEKVDDVLQTNKTEDLELPKDPNNFFEYNAKEDSDKPETLVTPDDKKEEPVVIPEAKDEMPKSSDKIDDDEIEDDIEADDVQTKVSFKSDDNDDLIGKLKAKEESLKTEQEEITSKLEQISNIKTELEDKIAEVKRLEEEAASIIE